MRISLNRKQSKANKSCKVYVQTTDAKTHATASAQLQSIKSLSPKTVQDITILSPTDPAPTGCAVFAVSTAAAVFLDVAGHVNVDEEITKAQAKMKKFADSASKQRKLIGSEDFKQKVSDAVQEEERKKLAEMEAFMGNYERTVTQFQELKLHEKK
jgi:valyl-tRNA synthetase